MSNRGCVIKGLFGCALVGALVIGLGVFGTWRFMSTTVSGFEESVTAREQLDQQFGGIDAYVPPPTATIPAARLERYVTVREATQPARERLDEFLGGVMADPEALAQEMEEASGGEKLRKILGIVGSSGRFGADMGNFFASRNGALIEQEMSPAEYLYLHGIVYFAWLEHRPGDDPAGVAGPMGWSQLSKIRGALHGMVRRQLDALPDDAPPAWRASLEAEVARLEADPERWPWQDEMPEEMRAALEPYRPRLEATFAPSTHGMELLRNRKRGRWSYTTDF